MMLIPIEYRIRCDNGEKCRAAYMLHRVKLGTCGPMVDLCPECAASEVSS